VKKILYSGGSPSSTVKYCYDGHQVIAEYDGSDTLLRKYVYGPGIDEPLVMYIPSDTYYYYHFDGSGSVAALSNTNNEIVERYKYDVFGNIIATEITENTENPYYFTGRWLDDETETK